jgi:hypothetical protein
VNTIIPQSESHEPVQGVGASVVAGAPGKDGEDFGLVHPAQSSPITIIRIIKKVPYLAYTCREYRNFT